MSQHLATIIVLPKQSTLLELQSSGCRVQKRISDRRCTQTRWSLSLPQGQMRLTRLKQAHTKIRPWGQDKARPPPCTEWKEGEISLSPGRWEMEKEKCLWGGEKKGKRTLVVNLQALIQAWISGTVIKEKNCFRLFQLFPHGSHRLCTVWAYENENVCRAHLQ